MNPHHKQHLRLFRRSLRRYLQIIRYGKSSLTGVPVFFANSFPKSGTHLLIQILNGFPHLGPAVNSGLQPMVMFKGDTGQVRSTREIVADLNRLLPGDITYGHLHAIPNIVEITCQYTFASYFIIRDPRDIVVSHVHYVTHIEQNHVHHDYFKNKLEDMDQRITASIAGYSITTSDLEQPEQDLVLPNIHTRLEPYLGWIDQEAVCFLRFEDLITDRESAIGRILDHAIQRGFIINTDRDSAISTLATYINPGKSPTFRSGKVGDWEKEFTPEHKRLFKDICGDVLIRLGYEADNNW